MSLRRTIELFESSDEFTEFKESFVIPEPDEVDEESLRDRALILAEECEPRGDRSDLRDALAGFSVELDRSSFQQIAAMLAYLAKILFRDVTPPIPYSTKKKILEYDGPRFFFVGHASYFDYMLAACLLRQLGLPVPVMHVAGTLGQGWASEWLSGFRVLRVPRNPSPIQHRAYTWLSAALAEKTEPQTLFARTSRYTVRSREGILREPYVPHAVVAAVKATGRALVAPVAISYAAIPEDRYLSSSAMLPILSMLPRAWNLVFPLRYGLGNAKRLFKSLEDVFSDVSVDIGEPFELRDDDSLNAQRISHRAVVEIARHKMIHPSHLVARAVQGHDPGDITDLRRRIDTEVENVKAFFSSRYRSEPPFHPLVTSDRPETIQRGIKVLKSRRAVSKSPFGRNYRPRDADLLQFYAYHADRRIYPLSGQNTMTVVNAGVWGYTLALHIGMNLLEKEALAENSLILYDSREELIERLTVDGRHPWHFKEIPLPRSVRPEADLRAAVGDTSLILIVTPSKYFYSTLVPVLELAPEGSDLVIATKGFVPETGLLPCETAHAEMERLGKRMRLSVLSGANLAHEIVEGGAAVTQIACEDIQTFENLKLLIETPLFRVVYSGDITGATIAAALKNVYAIGFGILEGSNCAPENFLATYSTLVTAEIRQFGMLLGASPETFDAESQAWMADLLATCRGGRSAKFGRDLASLDEKHGTTGSVRSLLEQYRKRRLAVEGYEAARYAKRIASQRGFHPPILGEIYSILHSGKRLDIEELMEKCLDALGHRLSHRSTPSAVRSRKRYGH